MSHALIRLMNSSYDMFVNRSSSYLPTYSPYPLSVSTSFRADNEHFSYHSETTSYTNSPQSFANFDISCHEHPTVSRSDRCLICDDRSSGVHFGVSTCEACKAFFRRTNLSSYILPAPCSPVRCDISTKTRNNCPSCRFDKCKRLGMDRENVIYGKPSKQQTQSDHSMERLTNMSAELINIFQNIQSFESRQQIESFGHMAYQFFYQQGNFLDANFNPADVIYQIFDCYKNARISDYYLIPNLRFRAILSLWLFVYYYETFLFKQKISSEKLTLLTKLLDMELANNINDYNPDEHHRNRKLCRIDFLNTFTKFADLLQENRLGK